MEVVSHHLKLTRCYILQTKIVHTLFKRVETFFYYNCQIHFTSNSGIRNTFYIYLYIYLNACHFQCIGYTLAKKTQKQTERKTHNTQGREGGGIANSPHKPDPKEHPKKPNKNIWSLFTNSKIKGTYKSRESIGWKWQSFTDRQQINHFINMPFSHLLLWRDALPRFAASPKKCLQCI